MMSIKKNPRPILRGGTSRPSSLSPHSAGSKLWVKNNYFYHDCRVIVNLLMDFSGFEPTTG